MAESCFTLSGDSRGSGVEATMMKDEKLKGLRTQVNALEVISVSTHEFAKLMATAVDSIDATLDDNGDLDGDLRHFLERQRDAASTFGRACVQFKTECDGTALVGRDLIRAIEAV